jgi:hypothetical protein
VVRVFRGTRAEHLALDVVDDGVLEVTRRGGAAGAAGREGDEALAGEHGFVLQHELLGGLLVRELARGVEGYLGFAVATVVERTSGGAEELGLLDIACAVHLEIYAGNARGAVCENVALREG